MAIADHAPFKRLTSDTINDTDREWLAMLEESMRPVSIQTMERLGFTEAHALCGVIAMKGRYTR